jgi:hypothetical protein
MVDSSYDDIAPRNHFRKSLSSPDFLSIQAQDGTIDTPHGSAASIYDLEPGSPISRSNSVVAFDCIDVTLEMDTKESWLGQKGSRARTKHKISLKVAERRDRWQKMKGSVSHALGLKWVMK